MDDLAPDSIREPTKRSGVTRARTPSGKAVQQKTQVVDLLGLSSIPETAPAQPSAAPAPSGGDFFSSAPAVSGGKQSLLIIIDVLY